MSHAALYQPSSATRVRPDVGQAAAAIMRPSRLRDRQIHIAPVNDRIAHSAIKRILIVTDDQETLGTLRQTLEASGREVLHASRMAGLIEQLARAEVDFVIADHQLPDGDGLDLLDALQREFPSTLTALITNPQLPNSPRQAFGHGAFDYLAKPVRTDEALAFLRRADSTRTLRLAAPEPVQDVASDFHGMLGTTKVMQECFRMISRVGRTDVTTLVTGESGTGKELVARALHEESSRRHRPFIALNCSALPSELVESELFGHTRGSFTGAVKDHAGLFESANGGTLFLDEIGDLGPLAQAKVLRALESGEVMRVGGTKCTHVDVRVIAATNRPLDEMVAQGKFREDLLYRLKVIPIALSPLRERKADITLLTTHFLQLFAKRYGMPMRHLDDDAQALVMEYDWPGNVRELRNVIEGALIMADGPSIAASDLPASLSARPASTLIPVAMLQQSADLPFVEARERALREFDRLFLSAALERNGGNIARTARALGLHRQSLQKLLARRDLRQSGELRRDSAE